VRGTWRVHADGGWVEGGFVGDHVLGRALGRADGPAKEDLRRRQVAGPRQPAIEHLTTAVDAAVQVVPRALDLHVGLVHQPCRANRLPMTPNFFGKGWAEFLNPAQDRPPADVDPPVGQNAGDAFSRRTQLQVIPDSEQDDVTWEAMT
jgi:hypothetical protein